MGARSGETRPNRVVVLFSFPFLMANQNRLLPKGLLWRRNNLDCATSVEGGHDTHGYWLLISINLCLDFEPSFTKLIELLHQAVKLASRLMAMVNFFGVKRKGEEPSGLSGEIRKSFGVVSVARKY